MTAWQRRAVRAALAAAAVAVGTSVADGRDPSEPGVLVLFVAGVSLTGWLAGARSALLAVWFASAGGALCVVAASSPAGSAAAQLPAYVGVGVLFALAVDVVSAGRGESGDKVAGSVPEPQTVAVLLAGERHFRRLAEAIPQILWSAPADGRPDYCNHAYYDPLGLTADTVLTDAGVSRSLHPDDGDGYRAAWAEALRTGGAGAAECRLRAGDGAYRWHTCRFLPVRDPAGRIERWFCTGTDIEEQRQAEEARRVLLSRLEAAVEERTADLSRANAALSDEIRRREQAEAVRTGLLRRIATAQEDERSRIARELHDQLGQYLAAVGVGLRVVTEAVPMGDAADRLARLREMTDDMGREMHRLAVELRPAALDDLGLHAAVRNYVEDWTRHTGVAVDYHASGSEELPRPVEIAAYRVVQEALTNILKHSQARHVGVVLRGAADSLRVVVEDDGRGFDTGRAAGGRLGLLGMAERVAQVGGCLEIDSEPGRGTAVVVRIPTGGGGDR